MELMEARRRILLNTPHIESANGDVLEFETDMKSPLKQCRISFMPVQEGSGEPSYDNVRPIKGWDGLIWYLNGRNLVPLNFPSDSFYGSFSTRSTTISSAANSKCWSIYVGKNRDIRYQRLSEGLTLRLAFADSYLTSRTGAVIYDAINLANYGSSTYNSGDHPYLILGTTTGVMNGTDRFDRKVQVHFGDANKGYRTPIDYTKKSVTWSDTAGTCYGGYIDLATGEMVVDWVYFTFDRNNRVNNSGTTETGTWMTLRITHKTPPFQNTPNNGDDYGVFSLGNWRYSAQVGKNRAYVNSSYVYAVLLSDIEDLTTAEGRTAYFDRLETNNIPIEVAYKRATPLRFQLTPQQINTLKGVNTIWSDANGNIDVKYWTH